MKIGNEGGEFQVKVVKVGFTTTTVKVAPTKVQRQKSFFFLLSYILCHCGLVRLAVRMVVMIVVMEFRSVVARVLLT